MSAKLVMLIMGVLWLGAGFCYPSDSAQRLASFTNSSIWCVGSLLKEDKKAGQ